MDSREWSRIMVSVTRTGYVSLLGKDIQFLPPKRYPEMSRILIFEYFLYLREFQEKYDQLKNKHLVIYLVSLDIVLHEVKER